jgi:hypothetical protein
MVSFICMMIASSVAVAAAQGSDDCSPDLNWHCPGSKATLVHAKTLVHAFTYETCDHVQEEIMARASGEHGWVDPHNGGVYAPAWANCNATVCISRTANPKHSILGKKYVDKQDFVLAPGPHGHGCFILACSESQGNSVKDFSTNYCDSRNLYCSSADGCKPVLYDFTSTQNCVNASSGQSDWSACIVKPLESEGMKCPGSKAIFGHAKTTVTATAAASCSDVKAEMVARASGQNGWVDPHNGGVYAVLASSDAELETSRTANPKHSVLGQKYVDKQTFTLTPNGNGCDISACSESQGTSMKDFSTNYCDSRNLYCGSADGCKPVLHDFTSTQNSVDASSGQSDFSACVVKSDLTVHV